MMSVQPFDGHHIAGQQQAELMRSLLQPLRVVWNLLHLLLYKVNLVMCVHAVVTSGSIFLDTSSAVVGRTVDAKPLFMVCIWKCNRHVAIRLVAMQCAVEPISAHAIAYV